GVVAQKRGFSGKAEESRIIAMTGQQGIEQGDRFAMTSHAAHHLGGAGGGEPVIGITRLQALVNGMSLRKALFPRQEKRLSQQKFAALRRAIEGFQKRVFAPQLIEQRIIVQMEGGVRRRAGNFLFENGQSLVKPVQVLKSLGAMAHQTG